jgi:Holliday junction resolvase RusA-like endonuclease
MGGPGQRHGALRLPLIGSGRSAKIAQESGKLITFRVTAKPIGVNQSYAPARWGNRHGFRLTPEGKGYRLFVAAAALKAMRGRSRLTGNCHVKLVFRYHENRHDIDGPIKLTLDALEGIVYRNDRQVTRLSVAISTEGTSEECVDVAIRTTR